MQRCPDCVLQFLRHGGFSDHLLGAEAQPEHTLRLQSPFRLNAAVDFLAYFFLSKEKVTPRSRDHETAGNEIPVFIRERAEPYGLGGSQECAGSEFRRIQGKDQGTLYTSVEIIDEGAYFFLKDAEALHQLVRMPAIQGLQLTHALKDLQGNIRAQGPHFVNAERMFTAERVFDLRLYFLETVPGCEKHTKAVAQDSKISVLLLLFRSCLLFLPAGRKQ